MAASTDKQNSLLHAATPPGAHRTSDILEAPKSTPSLAHRLSAAVKRTAPPAQQLPADPLIKLHAPTVKALQERRCRRRVALPPMYTSAVVRIISQREAPMEAHVLDLSETGMAIEMDYLLPVGQAVTIEFRVAGLGRFKQEQWSELMAACQVVRHDNLDDYPAGPYKLALRFIRITTMTQAQIARFLATQPG